MALNYKRKSSEEEDESVFISMTDLMISILFIVMILMAYFSVREELNKDEMIEKSTYLLVLNELQITKAELQQVIYEKEELEVQLEEAKKQIIIKEEEIQRLLKIIANLEEKIKDLEQKIRDLEQELEKYRNLPTLETELKNIANSREKLLNQISERLNELNIKVKVYYDSGILRFSEKELKFASGKYKLERNGKKVVASLAEILEDNLKCFTLGPFSEISTECNPYLSLVESIQIEGHTDNVDVSEENPIKDNLELSTERAGETLREILKVSPNLINYLNAGIYENDEFDLNAGQPILSVSGYGSNRPVEGNETKQQRDENRRIDLRFIMVTPGTSIESSKLIERIKLEINE